MVQQHFRNKVPLSHFSGYHRDSALTALKKGSGIFFSGADKALRVFQVDSEVV